MFHNCKHSTLSVANEVFLVAEVKKGVLLLESERTMMQINMNIRT